MTGDEARLRSDYGDIGPTSRSEAEQAVTDADKIVALLAPLASRPSESDSD